MIEFETGRHRAEPDSLLRRGYEEIYRTEPIQHLDSFYRWALRLVGPKAGSRLLDVSCGVGRLVDLAQLRGVRAVGVDLAITALLVGRQKKFRGGMVVGDAEALPFASASFDHVVNLGSLEHYRNPARGVAEMARVLVPSGNAVVLVPNTFSYLHVLYVWRHGRVYDDGQPLQRYGTCADWHRLLEENGLRVTSIKPYQRAAPRTIADLLWYMRRPRLLIQALISPVLPLHLASCFVFTCQPALDESGMI